MLRAAGGGVTPRRLRQAAALIFGIGLTAGLTIYLSLPELPDPSLADEFQNSKIFRHELEVYGGKMSVLGSQFSRWFSELWQGRQLGITIVVISTVAALVLVLAARLLQPDSAPDSTT